MMDDALQREVAARMVKEFAERGTEVVLVGSTAIVALGLYPKTSKDVDAPAPGRLGLDAARKLASRMAQDLGLVLEERGWGTLSLVNKVGERVAWRVDLLVPESGPIPLAAARLVRRRATRTEIGLAAIAEHILVMKAVAFGDMLGKGLEEEALKYEGDVEELRQTLPTDFDIKAVRELLGAFPAARAVRATQLINEKFGTSIREPPSPDVA